jgi:hypothetical protein
VALSGVQLVISAIDKPRIVMQALKDTKIRFARAGRLHVVIPVAPCVNRREFILITRSPGASKSKYIATYVLNLSRASFEICTSKRGVGLKHAMAIAEK